MQAGRLRQRVTIQDKVVLRDSFGEEIITWTDVATVWAGVEPLRGREFLEAQVQGADVTTRVIIRHRAGIRPEMRVIWTDDDGTAHIYDVQAVISVQERRREVQLMCRELLE